MDYECERGPKRNLLIMIDGVPLEAHGAFIYALSGCLLVIVTMLANQQNFEARQEAKLKRRSVETDSRKSLSDSPSEE